MTAQRASELFASGDLGGAIDVVTAQVKKQPTDQNSRGLLAEFLCIAGELERADKLLEVLGNQDAEAAPALALVRQVLRAELARREFFTAGRVPEFIGEPTTLLQQHLRAAVLLHDGERAQAAELLAEAELARPAVSGECNGQAFDDLRDLDDLTAPFFEVLTTTGSYYWIPIERLVSVEFLPPQRPRDLIWRRARMMVSDGPEGEVVVPAVYANPSAESGDQVRLGRVTDWHGGDGEPVLGVGQRTFLVGEDALPIMQLQTIDFSTAG
jgi:type VI secretion system protein ImpE